MLRFSQGNILKVLSFSSCPQNPFQNLLVRGDLFPRCYMVGNGTWFVFKISLIRSWLHLTYPYLWLIYRFLFISVFLSEWNFFRWWYRRWLFCLGYPLRFRRIVAICGIWRSLIQRLPHFINFCDILNCLG